MTKKVWLITGAGRGMGTDIAKAALAAGHAVVATGRGACAAPGWAPGADDVGLPPPARGSAAAG